MYVKAHANIDLCLLMRMALSITVAIIRLVSKMHLCVLVVNLKLITLGFAENIVLGNYH